ncbi:MAG: hypothetical protein KDD52_09390 [Bdellovibrionales bacterium]|nr:hypothetical protein [Bdellovibrionales bacterium]
MKSKTITKKFTFDEMMRDEDLDKKSFKNYRENLIKEVKEKESEKIAKYHFHLDLYLFRFNFKKNQVQIFNYILDDEYPDPLVMTLEDFYRQMCPWQYEDPKKTL